MNEKNRKKQARPTLLIQDVLLSCVGSLCAFLLVRWVSEPTFGFTAHLFIYLGAALVFTTIGLFISGASREVSRRASSWNGRRIIVTVLIKEGGLLILLLSGILGLGTLMILLDLLADIVFSVLFMIYPRMIITTIRREDEEIRSISEQKNTLVLGEDEAALELAEQLDHEANFNVIGLLTRKPEFSGKVLGDYVIYYAANDDEMERLQWRLGGIDCIMFPKKGSAPGSGPGTLRKEDFKPTSADHSHMSRIGRFVKRSFDIAFSGLMLVIFSPLIGICSLAIFIEDGKPVFYRQERIGKGGKPFNILKFRTMRVDAEAAGRPILYSGDEDPRLTRVGKFLRIHHLDELPQFWNVLVGDMSFIGYRPERQFFIDKIMEVNPRYQFLYQIRPGITSYATLYNGYTDTMEKMLTRLDMDLYYLRNHSVLFDFRILGLTFLSIVSGKKI